MAAKPTPMHQIRQIAELLSKQYSIRSIAKLTSVARNTVREYQQRLVRCGLSCDQLLALDDDAFGRMVYCDNRLGGDEVSRSADLENRMPDLLLELRRKGVTRLLLWDEYKSDYPSGYGYTQFCDHIARHLRIHGAVMQLHHEPGEQLLVDFAGDKLKYVDTSTGEVIECEILVCTLPFSQYTYVEAMASQKQEYFIKGLSNALYFLGGVPQSIKTDNLKSAVTKANRYEPTFTEAMEHFGKYYNTTVMAARVRKPRDKASVENAVTNTYRRIYAPLRNTVFESLEALNQGVAAQLEKHNSHLFQRKDYSRKKMFETEEKHLLRSLPGTPFQIRHVTQSKVQKNYHVILGEDHHQYSVPYTLIGKTLKLIYTADHVEIYFEQKRVALHVRNYRKHGYTSLLEHMPLNHAHMVKARGWDADYFLAQAKLIGTATHDYIARILASKSFPEQTYNSCLGILRLGKQYGNVRLEAACTRALAAPVANYGILSNILKNGLDKITGPEQMQIPLHDNLRGHNTYN